MIVKEKVQKAASPDYKKLVAASQGPDPVRSTTQLVTTLGVYIALWTLMVLSLRVSYAVTLLLSIPTAAFLVRLFMIQHDCGHGSYYRSRKLRDTVGFVLGVLTATPYHYWQRTHANHHSHSGNLDLRGFGDIDTMTVNEYRTAPRSRRIFYRIYRNPFMLLLVGPTLQFVIKHRFPWDMPRDWRKAWNSVWLTNLAIVGAIAVMGYIVGYAEFFMVQAPVTILAGTLGVYLFYVQHQFEETYWERQGKWDYFNAALGGCTHFVLPRPLQWMTASIGLHHVHHLSHQIPNYKLQDCLNSNVELQRARQIRIRNTFKLFTLSLWDEENSRMIGFRHLRKMDQAQS